MSFGHDSTNTLLKGGEVEDGKYCTRTCLSDFAGLTFWLPKGCRDEVHSREPVPRRFLKFPEGLKIVKLQVEEKIESLGGPSGEKRCKI